MKETTRGKLLVRTSMKHWCPHTHIAHTPTQTLYILDSHSNIHTLHTPQHKHYTYYIHTPTHTHCIYPITHTACIHPNTYTAQSLLTHITHTLLAHITHTLRTHCTNSTHTRSLSSFCSHQLTFLTFTINSRIYVFALKNPAIFAKHEISFPWNFAK